MSRRRAVRAAAVLVAAALLAGTAATADATGPAFAPRAHGDHPTVAEMTALGRTLFADPRLSASGTMACASCHDPATAFGPGPGRPSPFADGDPAHAGTRAIPSLRYLAYALPFAAHRVDGDENAQDGVDGGPSGGLTWDGRADTPHEQARIPLFAPNEMANGTPAALAARLRASPEAEDFRRVFSAPGRDVFDDPAEVTGWLTAALEVWLQDPRAFAPFSSRYDRVLRGQAALSPAEARGLAAFVDPQRGNCASCHPAQRRNDGSFPLFTDGGHVALGVPRRVDAGTDVHGQVQGAVGTTVRVPEDIDRDDAHDLGLCRSGRAGAAAQPDWCGRFRTPSLRNVAVRPRFFHNGAIGSLRDAVAFYATRDTDPGRWYGRDAQGRPRPCDDLPSQYVGQVERGVPFEPRADGAPRLSDGDIDDIVAFLRTLTDEDAAGGR